MPQATRKPVILVVDDEELLLKSVKHRLEREGFQVLTAATGEDGLKAAQEQRPDLVLLDIMLPKLKGREVCARLKANPATADIPVIFLTALGLADHVQGGMAAGAEDYIIKPFQAEELTERIIVCLARHNHWPPRG